MQSYDIDHDLAVLADVATRSACRVASAERGGAEMSKRKAGLLAPHRRLIERLLKREASHHRFCEKDFAKRAEDGGTFFDGTPRGPHWQRESIARSRKAELAEQALERLSAEREAVET